MLDTVAKKFCISIIWGMLACTGIVASTPTVQNIFFVDRQNGWLWTWDKNKSLILRSENGGESWHEIVQMNHRIINMAFSTKQEGWLIGSNGIIKHTRDGGITWREQLSNTKSDLFHIAVFDNKQAVVLTSSGEILYTTDSGDHWEMRDGSKTGGLYDIKFFDSSHLIAVGFRKVLISDDSGNSWRFQSSGSVWDLLEIGILNSRSAVVLSNNSLLRTEDLGNSWVENGFPPLPVDGGQLFFLDEKHGWAVLENINFGSTAKVDPREGISAESYVLATQNGGKNWEVMTSFLSKKSFNAQVLYIKFFTPLEGVIYKRDGQILASNDGGKVWLQVKSNLILLQLVPDSLLDLIR